MLTRGLFRWRKKSRYEMVIFKKLYTRNFPIDLQITRKIKLRNVTKKIASKLDFIASLVTRQLYGLLVNCQMHIKTIQFWHYIVLELHNFEYAKLYFRT